MNKKVGKSKVVIDDKEDLEIKNIAYLKNSSQFILLVILIMLFGFTLFSSLVYIGKYHIEKNNLKFGAELIEIKNNKNSIFIINDIKIEKNITEEDIKDDEKIVIERLNTIEFKTNKNLKEDGKILFDVKYDISNNDFSINPIASPKSDVLVRFSYSFDNENWTYIHNVISTNESNIIPLIGNYYDIAGIISNLKVATNYELSGASGETIKMYWKSETIIQGKIENLDKKLNANFKIEYKETA